VLEQLARQTSYTTASLQLFAPETAWLTNSYGGSASFSPPNYGENPQYGAAVFFNVPSGYNGSTPLTLSFTDSNGRTIRAYTFHLKNKHAKKLTPEQEENLDENQRRQHELDELTAVEPGMNTIQWDLRYAPAYDYSGFKSLPTDDFPDTADGPTIVPGAYTVVLQYGSARLTAPLQVELDPRIHPAAGELEARLALEMQLFASIDRLDRAIGAAMSASAKLPPARRGQVDAEIATLTLTGVSSSEYDVVKPSKIREQLGFLMNSLEGAYARPTAAEYAAAQELQSLAQAGEARLGELTSS